MMTVRGQLVSDCPFHTLEAITLNDSTTYVPRESNATGPFIYDAFYVGTGGNLTVTNMAGVDVVLKGLLAGTIYRMRCTKFKSTNATAADLVGLRY